MFKSRRFGSGSKNNTEDKQPEDKIVCYECNKPEQYISECPEVEKMKKKSVGPIYEKKKMLMSTQEDLDTFDQDEDIKVCLVTRNVESTSDYFDGEVNFSYLHSVRNTYYELLLYSSKLSNTYKDLCNQDIELPKHRNNLKPKVVECHRPRKGRNQATKLKACRRYNNCQE